MGPSEVSKTTLGTARSVIHIHARKKLDEVPLQGSHDEITKYLAEIIPELAELANNAGLDVTCYLLRVAHRDVQEALDREH